MRQENTLKMAAVRYVCFHRSKFTTRSERFLGFMKAKRTIDHSLKRITIRGVYEHLRSMTSTENKYFKLQTLEKRGLSLHDINIAIDVESCRSLTKLPFAFGNLNSTLVIRACERADFDYKQMIYDQHKAGMTYQALQKHHGISSRRISQIVGELGTKSESRNERTALTDEQVWASFTANGSNLTKTGVELGVTRQTVAFRIKRYKKTIE